MKKIPWEKAKDYAKEHTEEEVYDINLAGEILDEIIALYGTQISAEKKQAVVDEEAVASLMSDLNRFQQERRMIMDSKVVRKVLTLYKPALQDMIINGVKPKKESNK